MSPTPRRLLLRTTAFVSAAALSTLTGCVTVHGEREVIPSTTKAEARKALERFTDGYNTAYRTGDPAAIADVETGALHAMGQAGLTTQRATRPNGNPDYPPLELTDVKLAIPKQAGWPKFFVMDTDSNRDDNRWLLVFTRSGADRPWKASYLSILSNDEVPDFRTDKDGWAEPVAVGASSDLVVAPGRLSTSYTEYLQTGGGGLFADGLATSEQREARRKLLRTPTFWTEFKDEPAKSPQYAPVALRTADGGALAFFTTHHAEKRTMAEGYRIGRIKDATATALLTGKPDTWLTLVRISESAVRIPPEGQVVFLNRLEGLTSAKGG
jgi:hypothetical protein